MALASVNCNEVLDTLLQDPMKSTSWLQDGTELQPIFARHQKAKPLGSQITLDDFDLLKVIG